MIQIPIAAVAAVLSCLVLVVVIMSTILMKVTMNASKKESYDVEPQRESKKNKKGKNLLIFSRVPQAQVNKEVVQPTQKSNGFLEAMGMNKKKPQIIIDETSAMESSALGQLNFAITMDKDVLLIHIIQATNLPARDMCGSSDPYVRAFLVPGCEPVKVTRVHKRNLSPLFNQILEFRGHSVKKLEDFQLCMQVMDYDRFTRDEPIGEILLPMKPIKYENSPVYWKTLQKPLIHKTGKGDVLISLCYLPQSHRITVVVVRAKDLPAKDLSGASDPYVKLWLISNEEKIDKRKTTIKHHTLTPTYNESFNFFIEPNRMDNIHLVATVMDYDLLSSNDELGHVILGTKGNEDGKQHWAEMLTRPGYPTAMWHKLSPKW